MRAEPAAETPAASDSGAAGNATADSGAAANSTASGNATANATAAANATVPMTQAERLEEIAIEKWLKKQLEDKEARAKYNALKDEIAANMTKENSWRNGVMKKVGAEEGATEPTEDIPMHERKPLANMGTDVNGKKVPVAVKYENTSAVVATSQAASNTTAASNATNTTNATSTVQVKSKSKEEPAATPITPD